MHKPGFPLLTTISSTGATGYIGGTVLDTLANKRSYRIIALLRKVPDGFSSKYPDVNIVLGDYDNAKLISETAAKADIVVRK